MSDLSPFGAEPNSLPARQESGSNFETFTAPLDGFDFQAYEVRQGRLDEVLAQKDPKALVALIRELNSGDPEIGVKLNNIHNTTLEGDLPGLAAPLAVLSKTRVASNIPGLNFNGGVAPRASFAGMNFRGAEFVDSILTEADFRDADLNGADFTNAALVGADFTGAELDGADFSGAYLVDVKGLDDIETIMRIRLTAARTVIAQEVAEGSLDQFLASHFGDSRDIALIRRMIDPVPMAFDQTVPRLQTKRNLRGLVAQKVIANEVDFSSSQMVGAKIEDMAANGAQFRGVMMSGATIFNSMMRNVDLVSAWAPGLILEDVDLRGSRVTNANLVGAILRGVDLREVEGLDAEDTNIEGIVIDECKLPQGYGYNGIALERSQKKTRQLES